MQQESKVCPRCPRTGPQPVRNFLVYGPKNPQGRIHSYCFRCRGKLNAVTNAANTATIHASGKVWAENNPDKVKISKMNYRARTRYKATGTVTVKGWQAAKRAAGYKCLRCGSTEDLTPDHIIPLARGGENIDSNLQCLCFQCNSLKQDRSTDYR